MIDFREITINDKKLFDEKIKELGANASEFTFTNFFIWRNCYKFRFAEILGTICVIALDQTPHPYAIMPVGKIDKESFTKILNILKEYFSQNNWEFVFKRVSKNHLQHFQETLEMEKDIVHQRDRSDYIYLTEELINLKGKKYDAKRNHINWFFNNTSCEYVEINSQNIVDCKQILSNWVLEKDSENLGFLNWEKIASQELIDNFTELGCKGAMIKVDGVFEAFTVGEMLNEDAAVIHVEKANASIRGLYPFINQQFCKNAFSNTKYINREEDMGIEGLRKSKLSYHPYELLEKYSVSLK